MTAVRVCSVDGCETGGRLSRGLCKMHYARWTRHGEVGGAAKQHAVSWAGHTCIADECGNPVKSLGYCTAHLKRFKRYGDPLIKRPVRPAADRFWSRVNKNGSIPEHRPGLGPCWEWTRGKTNGYGVFHPRAGTQVLAHRWSYEQESGPIPAGYVVDHLCRNHGCVNPKHLEPVTNGENLRRGNGYALQNGTRDTCINGHQYTAENIYVDPTKNTIRCRECSRLRDVGRLRQTGTGRLLRPIDRNELLALYKSGRGASFLRAHFGVSLKRIYDVMEELDLPRRERGRPSRKAA